MYMCAFGLCGSIAKFRFQKEVKAFADERGKLTETLWVKGNADVAKDMRVRTSV